MNNNKVLLLFMVLSLSSSSYAQKAKVIDSLWQKFRYSDNDSIKLKAGNFLAFHYIFRTPERADSILHSATEFAKKNKQYFGLTELTNTRGIYYDVLGQKDSSKVYFKKALELSRKYKYTNIEVMCINNLGMFYWNSGQFPEALKYFYDALEFSNTHFPDNEKTTTSYLNNIGLIYQELEQYEEAIEYHNKALKLRLNYDYIQEVPHSYNNLGICYKGKGEYNKAEEYLKLAIEYANKSNQPQLVFDYYDNLGNVYSLQERYYDALNAYLKALSIPEKFNTDKKKFIAYSNIIGLYNSTQEYTMAKSFIEQADRLYTQDSTLYNFSGSYFENSAKTYYALRQESKGDQYFNSYLAFKDSLFSKENAQALANVEAKLKTKEKESELAKAKSELLEKEIQVREKNLLIYGSLSAIAIIIVISYLIIKSKQLKNNKIKKEAELQNALSKLELQNKLEEQRLRISRDLHDNIGSQLTFVISSLQYLQFQKKITKEETKQKLSNLSLFTQNTIHELRDTIWAMNKDKLLLADMVERLTNYINAVGDTHNITIVLSEKTREQASAISFNALQGIHIYRIIQESISNSIKHAKAESINIIMDIQQDNLIISIEDNGIGFLSNEVKHGNGLTNIKNRAEKLNAQIDINPKKNEGTTVKLIHQINRKA